MSESVEKSNLQVRLTLRNKGVEISTEGAVSDIIEHLDALATFADKVMEKFQGEEEVSEPPVVEIPTTEEIPTADIPAIRPSRSTTDNLRALFDTPWGRKPRSLAEVMKALEVNAVPDRTEAVGSYLIRLVKTAHLRRIKKEGKWSYFRIPSE